MKGNPTQKKVPFIDLKRSTDSVESAYISSIKKFLKRGSFILTPEVTEFEKKFGAYTKSPYVVGVSNGADAIFLSLLASGIGVGDEVITSGNAYNASVTAILRTGAKVRFADIDPKTLTMRADHIEVLINPKTKAILPVHLYGGMNDMDGIKKLASQYNLSVIEDSAQAHGSTMRGRHAGTWGDMGAFSFYPTKNLGAFGDAGAVVTADEEKAKMVRSLCNLGQTSKNVHSYLGFNMRLDPIQAIALSLKLKSLSRDIKERQKIASLYGKYFAKVELGDLVPSVLDNVGHSYHLYVIILPEGVSRDVFRENMKKRGVETAVHYPTVVYKQPFWEKAGLSYDPCPVAENIAGRIVSLPLYLGLKEEDVKYVVESVLESIK